MYRFVLTLNPDQIEAIAALAVGLRAFARAVSDGRAAWIYDVVVRSDLQKTGAGTAVMKLLLDHPAVRGCMYVRLSTRDAMEFYRRLGFLPTSEVKRPWPIVDMIKPGTVAVPVLDGLIAMARERPLGLDEMRMIEGVGERKLAQYGEAFVEAITEFRG